MAATYAGTLAGGDTTGTSNRTLTITSQIGNLYILFANFATNTNANATCSDDNAGGGGGTWTRIGTALNNTSTGILVAFVRDNLMTASASSVITVASGSNDSGELTHVRFTGMSRGGALAIRQYGKEENNVASLPNPLLPASALTENPTILAVAAGGGTSVALVPPTNWTSRSQAGQITPVARLAVATRDNGFTGTSAAWLDSKDWSLMSAMIVELDSSSMLASTVNGTGSAVGTMVNSGGQANISGVGACSARLSYTGTLAPQITSGLAPAYHVYHGARIFG